MSRLKNCISKYWYYCFAGLLLLMQAAVFLYYREESYPQIHDNLDLFMAHYQMIKLNGGFFTHGELMPMLGGIDRNLLGSEFLLYNILYEIFPGIWAYILGYFLKIAIGIASFYLLSVELLGEKASGYRPVILLTAVAYGLIPVFPTYSIAFTSVPLIAYFLIKLYRAGSLKKRLPWYVAVFMYPFLSYFSYHGFFILCYMCVAVIILWIRDKRFPKSTFASVVLLSLGYMAFEYRLFAAMLFDDTVTIRTTMDHGDITFLQALRTACGEFINASFHSQDSHMYLILPVTVIGLIIIDICYIRKKQIKAMFFDPANLIMYWIIFNCLIFGLYEYAPFRTLVETIVPKLTGFEFARTAYFNTLLWYALLLTILIRLYQLHKRGWKLFADVIVCLTVLIVMFEPQVYNDFYYTIYNHAYMIIKDKDTSTVNYREFYSTELFDDIKKDIDYDDEWAVAYGMHPAILQYNGIATLDGYLGMYSVDYRTKWRAVIAPALETSPELRSYYDGWGARAYLYSASDENTYAPLRELKLEDERLVCDLDALRDLGCSYIFSRVDFSNAAELDIRPVGIYTNESSPYTIYVYILD